jgi:hypothetical protein
MRKSVSPAHYLSIEVFYANDADCASLDDGIS